MAGKLRKRFTEEEVAEAFLSHPNSLIAASMALTSLGRGSISPQLALYWEQQLNLKKANGESYASSTRLDKDILSNLKLREVSPKDYLRNAYFERNNSRILVIPDLHAPYHHPDALDFLAAVAARYVPTRVISLGDETDSHALSMHDADPSLESAGAELTSARDVLQSLARMFPVMDIMHSNHGSLIYRRALKSGIPVEYIKSYRDILFPNGGGDGWEWSDKLRITLPNGEDALFQHQSAGDTLNNAAHERCSIIEGHFHSEFWIKYRASSSQLYFSMVAGSLVDNSALAFAYGKLFPKKPVIGCAVIIDSMPQLIPMPMTSEGRWTGFLPETC